jgi:hypothetical protein
MFLPGAAKYHDLPGLLALNAPHPLWLAGEPEDAKNPATAAYAAAGQGGALTLQKSAADASAAADWITR